MITDAHIHVQPWWELKPAVLEVMTRGRSDVDELQQIMKSPTQLLRRLDADGIERAVLVNYPSPDLMGFTHGVNEYVARYCEAAPDRLVPMGGVHPRFADDAGAEVRRAAEMGVRAEVANIMEDIPHDRIRDLTVDEALQLNLVNERR